MLTRQTPTIERPPPAYEPPTLALGPAGAGNAAAQDQLAASMAAEPQQQGLLHGFLDLIDYGPEDLARAKLEDQFVVSDEPVEGERAPNHLTEEEFQEVVELYMAIEAGETDIVIDAEGSDLDPGEFREKVQKAVARGIAGAGQPAADQAGPPSTSARQGARWASARVQASSARWLQVYSSTVTKPP